MIITTSTVNSGFEKGDTLEMGGDRYIVTNVISGHALTIRGYGWWDRFIASEFFQVVFWRPMHSLRWSDWMPDIYYEQQEWNEWERNALEALK